MGGDAILFVYFLQKNKWEKNPLVMREKADNMYKVLKGQSRSGSCSAGQGVHQSGAGAVEPHQPDETRKRLPKEVIILGSFVCSNRFISLVWGHCRPGLPADVDGHGDYYMENEEKSRGCLVIVVI